MKTRLSHAFFLLAALPAAVALAACGPTSPADPVPIAFEEEEIEQENQNQQDNQNQQENQNNQNGENQNSTDPNQNTTNQNNGEEIVRLFDGEPCASDAHCLSGTCLPDPEWPGGYCTTIACENFEDCADEGGQNACLVTPQTTNFCIRLCDPQDPVACREGYQCQPVGSGGDGWCAPNPDIVNNIDADLPFTLHCHNAVNGAVDLSFDVSDSAHSYMIVPITSNGGWLNPLNVTTPSGTLINFQQANAFQATGAALFGSINPTIIPAAPQFQYQLDSGQHTYRLSTQDSEICYYLIESTPNSTTIDLNLYLVGLDELDLSAANASTHVHLQAVLDHVDEIYSQAGITLGEIRYFDVSPLVEADYRIIRNRSDIPALVRSSTYPGDDADQALSANIFIVERFSLSDGDGILGISQGIPGAAALHESAVSGVALTGEYMGYSLGGGINGNEFTANTLAHELGHFLGLFHTSETTGQHHDPLDDTSECGDLDQPWTCPDWGNLMFPLADPANSTLTSDQTFVIGVNPLTK